MGATGALPAGITFVDNNDGTATLAGTAAAGTGGTYPLVVTASNGVSPNATQSFTLTVNQASAITSANSTTFTQGHAGSFSVTVTGFPVPSLSESGALPSGVTFVDNGNGTGTLSGTPAVGSVNSYPVTFTSHNGVGSDATQSFTLIIAPDNQPPVSNPDSYQMTKGTTLTVSAANGVLTNDTDADADALTIATPRPASGPSIGSLTLNADGSFSYTPPASFVGSATFTYKTTDGKVSSAAATVTITVQYAFTGYLAPVKNPGPDPVHVVVNTVQSGGTVPMKFSLGGNQGLDILASGYPKVQQVDCATLQPVSGPAGTLTSTGPAGKKELAFDVKLGQYTYGWKTDKIWANTCQRFVLRLIDGSEHIAYFTFAK